MKIIIYIIMVLAIASIIFNSTKLDFSNLLLGESQIGVISIVAALCVIILLSVLLVSFRIKDLAEKE